MKKLKWLLSVVDLIFVGAILTGNSVQANDKELLIYSNSLSEGRSD